jgi:outer membrane lipoprotein-sorting protein
VEQFFMEKFLRIGLMAIALTFVFGAFSATETKAQGALNEILKRMDEHNKALKSLRTNVVYEKFDSVVKVSDKMEGKAIYLPQNGKDALFRVDWTKPVESLAVVNKQYVIYRPRLQQAYVGSTEKAKKDSANVGGPLAFINMSKAQLKANYAMKYLGEETLSNGIKAWRLELTPKTAQKYKMAEIWVDGNGMPVQMKVIENNNDTSTVLLSNFEKNISLDRSIFKIDLPKGTKVVKN